MEHLKILILFFLWIPVSQGLWSQNDESTLALAREVGVKLGLHASDIEELQVSSQHQSSSSKLIYTYLQQQFQGIDIEGCMFQLVTDADGNLIHQSHGCEQNLKEKMFVPQSLISKKQAIMAMANHLGQPFESTQRSQLEPVNKGQYLITTFSPHPILVRKKWQRLDNVWRLVYDLRIQQDDHYWQYFIDASSGDFISRNERAHHCTWETGNQVISSPRTFSENKNANAQADETYLVYPLGVESPSHGVRQVITRPADPIASPFGWHDIDGVSGPDFFDTRGNNTFTQEDFNADDQMGLRPHGGESLIFDYALSTGPPNEYIEASLTNLFYWINLNHDIFYHYGFDEAAGNFQVNNYGNGGNENDPILADAQDGGNRNNATFFANPDGHPSRTEMYLWGGSIFNASLEVISSGDLPQTIEAVESAFSQNNKLVDHGRVTGQIVRVFDSQTRTSLACSNSPIRDPGSLDGKIALIDRGTCFFVEKVKNAQVAGAVAVIICNNVAGNPVVMGGNDPTITIPAVMISRSHCLPLIDLLENGKDIRVTLARQVDDMDLDSSLDNLIISHEYGHGITDRLTGGAGTVDCLLNLEQMGEGWSDYFGLMLTTDWQTASGQDIRGIGTYLSGQSSNGTGIREFPYTTDHRRNPLTYHDLRSATIPHGVGAIWCTMLWDMTWNIIDMKGASLDIYRGKGGNNIALQLVVEALKLQPCNPGFVDGRDAILLADQLLYEGEHQYAIWKAFADRGLGFGASQNSSNSVFDGIASFDLPREFQTEITLFEARDSLSAIVVDWTSLREINHDKFTLWRSTNLLDFEPVEEFNGGIFRTSPTDYIYEDIHIKTNQWYYYRLEQTDQDGIVRSLALDSAIVIPFDHVLVFPNPAHNQLHLKLSRDFSNSVQLTLYDMSGKPVYAQKVNAADYYKPNLLNLERLSAGSYTLQVKGKTLHHRRIVLF